MLTVTATVKYLTDKRNRQRVVTLFLSDVRISFSPVKRGQNQASEDEWDHDGDCSNHQDDDQDDRRCSHSRWKIQSMKSGNSQTAACFDCKER